VWRGRPIPTANEPAEQVQEMLKKIPDITPELTPRKPYREPKLTIYGNLQRLTMAKNKTNKESGVAGAPNTHS
jgi:hypothetical protein